MHTHNKNTSVQLHRCLLQTRGILFYSISVIICHMEAFSNSSRFNPFWELLELRSKTIASLSKSLNFCHSHLYTRSMASPGMPPHCLAVLRQLGAQSIPLLWPSIYAREANCSFSFPFRRLSTLIDHRHVTMLLKSKWYIASTSLCLLG